VRNIGLAFWPSAAASGAASNEVWTAVRKKSSWLAARAIKLVIGLR